MHQWQELGAPGLPTQPRRGPFYEDTCEGKIHDGFLPKAPRKHRSVISYAQIARSSHSRYRCSRLFRRAASMLFLNPRSLRPSGSVA